jgi:uncharacterized membrane protein/mono/diheme cytochrome c family protein
MDLISQFLGRLHPLIVHFPIGILFIAFFFECLSQIRSYKKLRAAVEPALLAGVICAIVSVITGLMLSEEGGYDDDLLERHKWLGIATAALAAIIYGFRLISGKYFQQKARRRTFHLILFVPLIILVSLTGHYGGSMTHGADYLFAAAGNTDTADPGIKLKAIQDVDNAVLYADLIQPILESRCYSCHSTRRQKGDLRLDGIEVIRRGGENGSIIEAGIPDSSSLFVRLMLPLEHEDHMPPNEKPQPSSAEIALIQSWIKAGADFDQKVSASNEKEKIKTYFASLVEQSEMDNLLPEEEVNPADEKVVGELKKMGVIVLPVDAESNYLSISFVNRRSASDPEVSLLLKLKAQIIWLDLARTTISDEGMKSIGQLAVLRRLSLQNTSITDQGVATLASLANLQYLNLAGSKISDKGLSHLSTLKSLRKVFVYQTGVTATGIREMRSTLPDIHFDTGGYALPKLLTDSVIVEFDPN